MTALSTIKNGIASIGNEFYTISFSAEDGWLVSICNRSTGSEYLRGGGPTVYLWTLLSDKRGRKTRRYANEGEPYKVRVPGKSNLVKIDARSEGFAAVLEISYRIMGGIWVLEHFESKPSDRVVWCRIKVDNRTDLYDHGRIVAVGFPQISGIAIGGACEDDVLVRPNRFGEKIANPVEKFGTYAVNLDYGGFASMQWQDIYSPGGGLYMASYDRTLTLTELESEADLEERTMRLGFRKYVYIPPGKSWGSEPFVLGIHEGDWHWAADRYREWAESWMEKPKIPEWVKRSDGWYGIGFHRGGKSKYRFSDIPQIFEEARELGLNHVQFWGQMSGPRGGCCYRFYHPDPRLGSVEELKRSIRYVRGRGGHIGFYFNIQAFDPLLPRLPDKLNELLPPDIEVPSWEEFRKYALRHFDGSYVVQYPGVERGSDGFRLMCLCSDGWRGYLRGWIERYLRDYGADVVYLDQTSSPPITYCFGEGHGHAGAGDTLRCRVDFVREVVEVAAEINPDSAVVIEGNGDVFGQHAHIHLYTSFSTQTRYPCPEVFYYTFPHYIIMDGFANPPSQETLKGYYPELERRWTERDVINRVFLMGFRFDLCLYERISERGEIFEYFKEVVRLRKRIKEYQYSSTFLDDVYLGPLPHLVEAKLFKGEGFLLVTLLDNREDPEEFAVEIDLRKLFPNKPRRAVLHTLGGDEEVRFEVRGDTLRVDIPGIKDGIGAAVIFF